MRRIAEEEGIGRRTGEVVEVNGWRTGVGPRRSNLDLTCSSF